MSYAISPTMRHPKGIDGDKPVAGQAFPALTRRHRESRRPAATQIQHLVPRANLPRRQWTNQALSGSQQGFVLVVALILLLVLTLLGLAAAQSTSLQERMAGNARNHDIAFQAAESALVAGQTCVNVGVSPCAVFNGGTTGGDGMYVFDPTLATAIWNQQGFWATSGNTLSYSDYTGQSLPQVATQPQFIVEEMPPVAAPGGNIGQAQFGGGSPQIRRYRITSLGVGGDGSSTVMLQAVVTN